jgi:hypothetical protein
MGHIIINCPNKKNKYKKDDDKKKKNKFFKKRKNAKLIMLSGTPMQAPTPMMMMPPQLAHVEQLCDICVTTKHRHAPFPKQDKYRADKPL